MSEQFQLNSRKVMVEQTQEAVGSEVYQGFLNNDNRRNSHTKGRVDAKETFHIPYVFSTCVPIYTAPILPSFKMKLSMLRSL